MKSAEFDSQSEVTIRQATRSDIDAIADLWMELIAYHAERDPRFGLPPNGRDRYILHLRDALQDAKYRVLVAENGGRIVGYVSGYIADNPPVFPNPRYGFVADLYVANGCRRHGAGRRLVGALVTWFRAKGLRNVQLNAAHRNPASQSFWRALGCTDYLDHLWLNIA